MWWLALFACTGSLDLETEDTDSLECASWEFVQSESAPCELECTTDEPEMVFEISYDQVPVHYTGEACEVGIYVVEVSVTQGERSCTPVPDFEILEVFSDNLPPVADAGRSQSGAIVSIQPDALGTWTFGLEVNDGILDSEADYVDIVVLERG